MAGAAPVTQLIHATCVQLGEAGVLLLGPSGCGKSDLALRLIDAGARLVADDQVRIRRRGACLFGAPAARLAGLMEVRGLGILRLGHVASSALHLAVALQAEPPRLPEPAQLPLHGLELPLIAVDARTASAVAKIKLALTAERVA